MTASDLQPDLRALIDARLDTIDQILIRAQVPWSERRSTLSSAALLCRSGSRNLSICASAQPEK